MVSASCTLPLISSSLSKVRSIKPDNISVMCTGLLKPTTNGLNCRYTKIFEQHLDTLTSDHAARVVHTVCARIMASSTIYTPDLVSYHTDA